MKLYLMALATTREGTPAPGYLIQTTRAGQPINILVDSGYPDSTIGNSGYWIMTADHIVTAQLARIGLGADDIHVLVCTHLDPDHAGNHHYFGAAECVIQRAQYEFAQAAVHVRTGGLHARWNQPHLHYTLIDGDYDLADGVRLIETSGHVPGHQSVLVTLPGGKFLLAIDAITRPEMMDADTRTIGSFDMDETSVRASTHKLVALAEHEGATIIFGHDARQWAGLRLLPGYYE